MAVQAIAMNKIPPPEPHRHVTGKTIRVAQYFSAICLTVIAVVSAAHPVFGAVNHRPTISPIPDQRRADSSFQTKYFRIVDYDPNDPVNPPTKAQSPSFYPSNKIVVAPCDSSNPCPVGSDANYYVKFEPVSNLPDGMSTVTVTVSDSNGATAATSFTIQKDSVGIYPPTIANIPNETGIIHLTK